MGAARPPSGDLARRLVLLGLVAVTLWSMDAFVSATVDEISFEPTDADRFRAFVARAMVTASSFAFGICALGVLSWFLARRSRRLLAVAAATAVMGACVLVWGTVARSARSHPEYARGRAVATFVPPAGFVDQGIHLDHPDVVTAPAATRTWSTILNSDTCPEVEAALRAWADPGTVRPANNGVERCYWSAAWHGHEVDLNVLASRSGPMANVSLRLAG